MASKRSANSSHDFASRTGLIESYRLVEHKPLSKVVELGGADTLKIILTTREGKTAKRPHQAFLLLRDVDTGLDISYAFNVKDNGKAKVDLVMQCGRILL